MNSKIKKTLIVVGVIFAFCMFVKIVGDIELSSASSSPGVSASRSDKAKFTDFYKAVMGHAQVMEAIYNPFQRAISEGDGLRATQIALNIKDRFNQEWSAMYNMSAPDFANAVTAEKTKDAKDTLAAAYFCKTEVLKKFINAADKPTMKNIADMKNSAEQSQAYMLAAMAKFFDAASTVGITPEEITEMTKKPN